MPPSSQNKQFYRQSIVILVTKLIILEVTMILFTKALYYGATILSNTPDFVEWFAEGNSIYWTLRLIEIIAIVWITLFWASKRYEITSQRVVVTKGVFVDQENVYLMNNIENVKLYRPFLGMIFGYGNIKLYAPTLNEYVCLDYVPDARNLAKRLTKYVSAHKKNVNIMSSKSK